MQMHNKFDVFICGSGSAGLSAATWLARCGVRCKIVDSRSGPLEFGQADGAQVRSVEIFESFGIVDEILRVGYHNVEVTFWNPDGKGGGLVRTRSAAATHPGLSHLPRVMLSQAKFNGIFLEAMKKFNEQEVDYGYKVVGVKVDEEKSNDPHAYPVTIVTEKNGKEETFMAKYALVGLVAISFLSTFGMTVFRAVMVRTALFEGPSVTKWLEILLILYGASWTSSFEPTSQISENR